MHRLSGRMGHVCVEGLGPRCAQTVRAYGEHVCVEGLGPRCAQTVRAYGACLCRGFRS